jgi:hypothetical protein
LNLENGAQSYTSRFCIINIYTYIYILY